MPKKGLRPIDVYPRMDRLPWMVVIVIAATAFFMGMVVYQLLISSC